MITRERDPVFRLEPGTKADDLLINRVRAFGVRAMARNLGCSPTYICHILRGKGTASKSRLNQIVRVLKGDIS